MIRQSKVSKSLQKSPKVSKSPQKSPQSLQRIRQWDSYIVGSSGSVSIYGSRAVSTTLIQINDCLQTHSIGKFKWSPLISLSAQNHRQTNKISLPEVTFIFLVGLLLVVVAYQWQVWLSEHYWNSSVIGMTVWERCWVLEKNPRVSIAV